MAAPHRSKQPPIILVPLLGLLIALLAFDAAGSGSSTPSWRRTLVLPGAFPSYIALSAAFSADGKELTTLGLVFERPERPVKSRAVAKRWHVSSGRELSSFPIGASSDSAAFSSDGKLLAIDMSAPKDEHILAVWDANVRKQLCTLGEPHNHICYVAFSPDSKLLAATRDRSIRLWDLKGRKEQSTFKSKIGWPNSVAFTANGKMLAVGSASGDDQGSTVSDPGAVEVWDLQTGKSCATLMGHSSEVLCIAFAPDGKTLASASYTLPQGEYEGDVWLWDTATFRVKTKLGAQAHTGPVRALAFSPKGDVIATGSDDGTVMLWDTATGLALQTLNVRPNNLEDIGPSSIAFGPDGNTLVVCCGSASIWTKKAK